MLICFIFILTICWISFVVALTHRTLLSPLKFDTNHSQCDDCLHPLSWWQLIPVIGWLLQKGRCHWCHQPIDAFNPMIELVLATWYIRHFQFATAIPYLIALTSIIIITTTDWYEQWINLVFLSGLLPLRLVQFSDSHWYILELALVLVLLWMNFHHQLGIGDTAYPIVLIITVGLRATCWIILIACLLILLTHRRQPEPLPMIPYLNLGLILVI